jgi:putative DNA primase/helicase
MLTAGVLLENAADMAKAFPELWSNHEAARKQTQRSGTSCYYRNIHNSNLSHSSAVVTYRPSGAGQKDREARFDLALIPDPRVWLEARLGPLAHFEVTGGNLPAEAAPNPNAMAHARARLAGLSTRRDAAMHQRIATDRVRLAALSARLEATKPTTAAA